MKPNRSLSSPQPTSRLVRPLLCAAGLLACAAASAQTLKTLPLAGLWESQNKITVNGADLMAQMRAAQAEALKGLSAAERAQVEQMMKAQGVDPFGSGPQQECLTAAQVAKYADPKAWLNEMNADDPSCRYELVSVTADTVNFKGRCRSEDGYTGDILGSMTQHDPKRYSGRATGKGRWGGPPLPGAKGAAGSSDYLLEFNGRWVAASCGKVAPR